MDLQFVANPTLNGNGSRDVDMLDCPATSSAWEKKSKSYVNFSALDLSGSSRMVDGDVVLDEEEIAQLQSKLEAALVGRLLGRRMPCHLLSWELYKLWGHFEGFKLLDVGSDCFVCPFENAEDRDEVLRGSPWIVAGQVLGLDVWSPDFTPSSLACRTIPIWIRLPGLPLYCWGLTNFARIALSVGTPLWVDPCTASLERATFARICVKVDLSKPLKAETWVRGSYGRFLQRIEYEGLSAVCLTCGKVGHQDTQCPLFQEDSSMERTLPSFLGNQLRTRDPVSGSNAIVCPTSSQPSCGKTCMEESDSFHVAVGRGLCNVVGARRSPRRSKEADKPMEGAGGGQWVHKGPGVQGNRLA
ncbi:5'-3' exoribonuclease 2 [Apostasia shenzhenica]|uniref:5'-3' exoribonuclease 2 n=1 Tax=Apostasia shenzhenica TaxID=1088818 RepID=A0A2I0AVR6_9ASPA|nr:5'-3' exoribonuclease 2 [Apostasia shenzhenica]